MLEKSKIHAKEGQVQRTMSYLKDKGTITSGDAFYQLGISYLPVVIRDLKRQGKKIYAKFETRTGRFGMVTFKRYSLKKLNGYKKV